MDSPNVLFINCSAKRSPEVSNTEALWHLVATQYRQRGCPLQQMRVADISGALADSAELAEQMQAAEIVLVGVTIRQGTPASQYQRLAEHLRHISHTHGPQADPATGQPPLYGRVLGVLGLGDSAGGHAALAQTCYDFSQMGCINPPYSTVAWFQPLDTDTDFIEAEGHRSATVNRQARLLVAHSVAIAERLRQMPLAVNLRAAEKPADKVAETATPIDPKPICTSAGSDGGCIVPPRITKRIWTVMQSGMARGFTFSVLSLEDKVFRAERGGRGFIYKIYPGHFSFRRQYRDYDHEQSKSRKLMLMQQHGLPVPAAYGTFAHAADIPADLPFPIVAKPDSGSLSRNVFPNLRSAAQVSQAAATIEGAGETIKLESHVWGDDYRVLVLNHQYAGCVQRRPASVVGDGVHTILELFHGRNQEPGRGDRYEAHTTIHQLVFDDTSRRLLRQMGHTLDTVPPAGKRIYLQEKITAATGSDYVDYTERLHPSIAQSCVDFSYQFSTLTLGFDLITTDISRPLVKTGGAFNEYNFLPYVDLHENCNEGQKRPVCRLIWDYIEANAGRLVTPEFAPF
ncbi:MAG: hypothetical protein ACFB5Z_16760 [Elainellaceae cyanobacterium]